MYVTVIFALYNESCRRDLGRRYSQNRGFDTDEASLKATTDTQTVAMTSERAAMLCVYAVLGEISHTLAIFLNASPGSTLLKHQETNPQSSFAPFPVLVS